MDRLHEFELTLQVDGDKTKIMSVRHVFQGNQTAATDREEFAGLVRRMTENLLCAFAFREHRAISFEKK